MTALNPHTQTKYPAPPHILVMEDDLSVAKGLQTILSEEGYDVDLAHTGELAMKAFKESLLSPHRQACSE